MAAKLETSVGCGEIDEDDEERGIIWDLEQKLDQPMDEEAYQLRNTYREKRRRSSAYSGHRFAAYGSN